MVHVCLQDGRDRSLDYKLSNIFVPHNSWDAQTIDALKPLPDEMVFPKCSSSVFISTNIDYKLRNLCKKQVIVVGGLTDQCIDSCIRDACDKGYLVTVVTDACITFSRDRHEWSLRNNSGYCRQRTAQQVIDEIYDAYCTEQPSAKQNPSAGDQAGETMAELWTQKITTIGSGLKKSMSISQKNMLGSHCKYIRYEIIDFNGKALSKVVPFRHKDKKVELFQGTITLGANGSVMALPEVFM